MNFHALFEKMLKELNSMKKIDFSSVSFELESICDMFRISKIATKTYQNAKLEELGKADVIISYDSGPCPHKLSF